MAATDTSGSCDSLPCARLGSMPLESSVACEGRLRACAAWDVPRVDLNSSTRHPGSNAYSITDRTGKKQSAAPIIARVSKRLARNLSVEYEKRGLCSECRVGGGVRSAHHPAWKDVEWRHPSSLGSMRQPRGGERVGALGAAALVAAEAGPGYSKGKNGKGNRRICCAKQPREPPDHFRVPKPPPAARAPTRCPWVALASACAAQ